jgi:DNA (cytosine-5)-methyltransferase 1
MLVEPTTQRPVAEIDILFRMLQPHELAGAFTFPRGYQFTGTKTEQVKQIGNAVPVKLAEACTKQILLRAFAVAAHDSGVSSDSASRENSSDETLH